MPTLRIPTLVLSFALAITACTHRSPTADTEAATATEASASPQLTCNPGTHQCIGCNGGTFCAVRCPECAPPAAPDEGNADTAIEASASPQTTCSPGTRQCVGCNGGTFCAVRCPECAPPAAPAGNADNVVADLTPVGEACGGSICKPGLTCCNPSCGTCVPKGVECTQQTCN